MSTETEYRLSLDPSELQMEVIHAFLSTSYWAQGLSREVVEKAIRHSLPVGAYAPDGAQVGFARLVTDYARFGWVSDVFVLEPHRGRGLAGRMVRALLDTPGTCALKRVILATRDAHGVYRKCGFEPLSDPAMFMQRLPPGPGRP